MTGNNGRLSATKAQKQKINFFFQAGNKNPNKESKLKPETQRLRSGDRFEDCSGQTGKQDCTYTAH